MNLCPMKGTFCKAVSPHSPLTQFPFPFPYHLISGDVPRGYPCAQSAPRRRRRGRRSRRTRRSRQESCHCQTVSMSVPNTPPISILHSHPPSPSRPPCPHSNLGSGGNPQLRRRLDGPPANVWLDLVPAPCQPSILPSLPASPSRILKRTWGHKRSGRCGTPSATPTGR